MSELPLAEKEKIILRYARLTSNGKPMFCKPSREELSNPNQRREAEGTDWKIIYDSVQDAEDSAREMCQIGAEMQYAYPCRRSSHNHFHLSRDKDLAKKIQRLKRDQQEVIRELSSRNRRRTR